MTGNRWKIITRLKAARCVVQDAREEKSENLVKLAHFCICIERSFKARIIVFNCNAMHFYFLLWFLLTLKLSPVPSAALQSRKCPDGFENSPRQTCMNVAIWDAHNFFRLFLHRRHAGSYICGVCGKKYKYYNCFQTHVRAHRGKSSIYIFMYNFTFSSKKNRNVTSAPCVCSRIDSLLPSDSFASCLFDQGLCFTLVFLRSVLKWPHADLHTEAVFFFSSLPC